MKKILSLAVAVTLLMASCVKENISLNGEGGEVNVTFTTQLPISVEVSRAIADGSQAVNVHYAIYDAKNNNKFLKSGDVTAEHNVARIDLNLIKGEKYNIAFWAQADGAPYSYDNNSATVTANYNGALSNNEKFDAFFAVEKDLVVNGPVAKQITLYRPFAQVNLGVPASELADAASLGVDLTKSAVTFKYLANEFNLLDNTISGDAEVTFAANAFPTEALTVNGTEYKWLAFNYVLAPAENTDVADVTFEFSNDQKTLQSQNIPAVNFKRNHRTNILGRLITGTASFEVTIDDEPMNDYKNYEEEVTTQTVHTAADLQEALTDEEVDEVVLSGDIDLNDLFTRAADVTLTIASGVTKTIDLNGFTLSATSTQTGKNYDMIDVRGTLTVENGTIVYEHVGENMGWGRSTNIFNVTAGGVLNLNDVTAKNLGGSDMGFVAHLNNWGEVTLNVENSTLESNYVAVRVFNSGYDMNNVTIKNSTLKGGNYAFWVHNYTVEDFGSEAKAESQKALLNLAIYNQDNTFSPDVNGLRYGFTNSVKSDAYGITKVVSEDGATVTLGSVIENGLVRRGVAGAEENTTITKVIVEEGVGVLYDRTFRRFYALETVELPSTLTTIGAAGSGVFQSCTNLKNIVLPESVTVLGKGSFQECSSLESINIPAGVTRIESDALRATGLKEVEFHAGVTYFGAQAFRDCKQLTKVVINAPVFTMENNTFGIMTAPFTPMTIEVANAEMKAYVESMLTAHAKTYITVVAPDFVSTTADLQDALAKGKNVALANDLTISYDECITAPYGNKTAFSQNGGVFNGNGKTISQTAGGDHYVVMTNGGTIKNLNINNGFRGIVVMYANQTVNLNNVVVSGNVCYALNTAEGDSTQDLVATNCTFNGWSSWSLLKSATFTNCSFGQGEYYTNVSGRLGKPYVNTLFDGCEFGSKYYIDLSKLGADQVVTLKNCTVNGVKLTAENWTSLVAPEDTCGDGQISVELKNGTYLTAENVADYIVIE